LRNEGKSVAQHGLSCAALWHFIRIPCCYSYVHSSQSFRWCIALQYLTQRVRVKWCLLRQFLV